MKIGKLGYLSFSMLLAGVVACGGDDGGGGGDDDGTTDDGTADDGTGDDGTGDDGTGDDGDGTGVDAGDPGPDADPEACVRGPAREVPNEGWLHVAEGSEITYANEPPASGNHYSVWGTWDVHFELARGYWVHNVEHGGIVLLHRPDAPEEVVTALRAAFDAIPDDAECGHKRAMLAQDVDLTSPVAIIAADRVMTGACIDADSQAAILTLVEERRGQGPEDICDQGTIQ
jgi:hypothetical protein